ncbi:MAG: hypothetical protein A3F18_02585 [Legionellales bacterium RIFCSPHIGHO2_12_FULL_37_14]|nr:MAG: hypothetical protein A3F18_02585 [Legionellales bacterium RIFCSPHIGHO2_12_FULL_37_14]
MTNFIADYFLYFANPATILAFFIAGYCLSSRKYCVQFAALCSLDILVNTSLKGFFTSPLAGFMHHKGYVFPSGHTQFATVFYGYIAFFGLPEQLKKSQFIALNYLEERLIISSILIIGVGYGLIHYHYHNLEDVIAGFLVGLGLVFVYQLSLLRFCKTMPLILFITASLLLFINFLLYKDILDYVWTAYSALCILLLAQTLSRD